MARDDEPIADGEDARRPERRDEGEDRMSNPQRYRWARLSKKQAEKDVAKFKREGYGAKTRKDKSGEWAVYRTSYRLEKRTRAKHKRAAKKKAPKKKKKTWKDWFR